MGEETEIHRAINVLEEGARQKDELLLVEVTATFLHKGEIVPSAETDEAEGLALFLHGGSDALVIYDEDEAVTGYSDCTPRVRLSQEDVKFEFQPVFEGDDPPAFDLEWLKPHLKLLAERAEFQKEKAGALAADRRVRFLTLWKTFWKTCPRCGPLCRVHRTGTHVKYLGLVELGWLALAVRGREDKVKEFLLPATWEELSGLLGSDKFAVVGVGPKAFKVVKEWAGPHVFDDYCAAKVTVAGDHTKWLDLHGHGRVKGKTIWIMPGLENGKPIVRLAVAKRYL